MDIIEEWLLYLKRRGRSPATIATYRSVMRGFPDPLDCTLEQAEAWFNAQDEDEPATVAKRLATVQSFYVWAARFDKRLDSPVRRLDPPKLKDQLPKWVSRAELRLLLMVEDDELRRAFALGAYAGLRVEEAAALKWEDIDEDGRWITVRDGKGGKDRVMDCPPLLMDELLPNTGGNVVRAGGEPYTANALQRKANRTMARLGVDKTFHKLRARYATVGYAETGDLLAMQRALGHANPKTTAKYAATNNDALRAIGSAVTKGLWSNE